MKDVFIHSCIYLHIVKILIDILRNKSIKVARLTFLKQQILNLDPREEGGRERKRESKRETKGSRNHGTSARTEHDSRWLDRRAGGIAEWSLAKKVSGGGDGGGWRLATRET